MATNQEPLTREQFQRLRDKGLSVDQIIRFEQGFVPPGFQAKQKESPLTSGLLGGVGKFGSFLKGTFENIGKVGGVPIAAGIGGVVGLFDKEKGHKITEAAQQTVKGKSGQVSPGKVALTAGLGALEATPFGLGAKATMGIATKIGSNLVARATRLYQSALKPSSKLAKEGVVETALKEGIKVSKKGLSKITGLMEDIGEDIGKVIDAGAGAGKKVDTDLLINYAIEGEEYLSKVIGGGKLVKQWGDEVLGAISDLQKRFGKFIPVEEAQKIKQKSQGFLNRFYGREASLPKEVAKDLTRGLKTEIAEQVPEVAALNARDTKLFPLEEALENALKRLSNRELISLSDAVIFGGGVASGGPVGLSVGLTFFKRLLESPAFKSSRAIFYNKMAESGTKAFQNLRIPVALSVAKVLDLLTPFDEFEE